MSRVLPKDERGWTLNTLLPLLRHLGFYRVDYVHGPLEAGRDIVVADYDRFGLVSYFAIQAKDGDLRAQSKTAELSAIIEQLRNAQRTPYRDPLSSTEHKITATYLVVNGTISESARNILYSEIGGRLKIIDQSQLDVARYIGLRLPDEQIRSAMLAVQACLVTDREALRWFMANLDSDTNEVPLELPIHPIRTRALDCLLQHAWIAMAIEDTAAIETLSRVAESFNYLLSQLVVASSTKESAERSRNGLRFLLKGFLDRAEVVSSAIGNVLDQSPPRPGERYESGVIAATKDGGCVRTDDTDKDIP